MVARVMMLDTTFEITAARADDLYYTNEFLRAYGQPIESNPLSVTQRIEIGSAAEAVAPVGSAVQVHRSKHPHWNFDGVARPDGVIAWPTRGISVTSTGSNLWRIDVADDAGQAIVGEAIFHALRSIALYHRSTEPGPMLHASGIVNNGAATLFTGAVSAGKTTLLTEAVVTHGATPLTNDRTRLRFEGNRVIADSWPSYASFCEGTLLDYDALREAAERFESDDNAVRTIRFDDPLRSAYDKSSKRIYPMSWFTDALDVQFASTATLRTIVISHLDVAHEGADVRELGLGIKADRELMSRVISTERFDYEEPSFRPWHGLALPETKWSVDRVLDELFRNDVRVLSVRADPRDLAFVADLL